LSPARQRLATSRKRVLRGGGVTHTAKRRQRAWRPCDWASKGPHRWGQRVQDERWWYPSAAMAWRIGLVRGL